jgi:flagellin-like protein
MKKGQSQIVSAIIVVLVILTIVGTVFPWASSVIQKKKDSKSVEDVYNFFNQLEASIIDIARNGGEESLELQKMPKEKQYQLLSE